MEKSMANKRGGDAGDAPFLPVKDAERRSKTAIIETYKTNENGRPIIQVLRLAHSQ
jgi:hypothetical protein